MALVFRQDEEVRVVDDQVPIRNGVAEADQFGAVPSAKDRVRAFEGVAQGVRDFCGRPIVGGVEGLDLIDGQVLVLAVAYGGGGHGLFWIQVSLPVRGSGARGALCKEEVRGGARGDSYVTSREVADVFEVKGIVEFMSAPK